MRMRCWRYVDSSTTAIETLSCWDSAYVCAAGRYRFRVVEVECQLGAHVVLVLLCLGCRVMSARGSTTLRVVAQNVSRASGLAEPDSRSLCGYS
jgi:hypothetical protein